MIRQRQSHIVCGINRRENKPKEKWRLIDERKEMSNISNINMGINRNVILIKDPEEIIN